MFEIAGKKIASTLAEIVDPAHAGIAHMGHGVCHRSQCL